MMDALQAILTRRSTRRFTSEKVDDSALDTIITAGKQAPSGGNNQTNHFLVIRSRAVLDKLIDMVQTAFSHMEVTPGMYPSLRHSIEASKKGGYVFCYDAPVLIAVANRCDYGNNIADCACAIENMMVAANALDLGSCWINQLKWLNEDPDITAYLRELGLNEGERVYGAVSIGHPASPDGQPDRRLMPQKGNVVTYIY